MNLTKQERKVYDYIRRHRGCTTRDIIRDTYVTCPSGRITEMRSKGVPIVSIGHRKYTDARPFEMYAIEEPKPVAPPKEEATAKQLALV
jgi:hypothetical protein